MLRSMTPAEFAERYAAYLIDPGTDSWEVVATICATIVNMTIAAHGGEGAKHVDAADLMPKLDFELKQRRKAMSADDFERYAAQRWG